MVYPSYRYTVIPFYRYTIIPFYRYTVLPLYHFTDHTSIPSTKFCPKYQYDLNKPLFRKALYVLYVYTCKNGIKFSYSFGNPTVQISAANAKIIQFIRNDFDHKEKPLQTDKLGYQLIPCNLALYTEITPYPLSSTLAPRNLKPLSFFMK